MPLNEEFWHFIKQILPAGVISLSNKPQAVNKTIMQKINTHILRHIMSCCLPCLFLLLSVPANAISGGSTDGWTLYPSYGNITEIEPTGKEVYVLASKYKECSRFEKQNKYSRSGQASNSRLCKTLSLQS